MAFHSLYKLPSPDLCQLWLQPEVRRESRHKAALLPTTNPLAPKTDRAASEQSSPPHLGSVLQ